MSESFELTELWKAKARSAFKRQAVKHPEHAEAFMWLHRMFTDSKITITKGETK